MKYITINCPIPSEALHNELTKYDSEALKKFLRSKLLNRNDIRLEVNTKAFRQDSLVLHGEIIVGEKSLNYSLLKNGFGIYEEQIPGELEQWIVCRFQKAAESAKSLQKGIWFHK